MIGKPTFIRSFLFAVVSGCLFIGCAKPLSPQEVAAHFWTAIESGEPVQVKKFVSEKDRRALDTLDEVLPISGATFGKIVIDENLASIETTVTLNADRPIEFPLNTYLLKEGDRWAVDYAKTIASVSNASQFAEIINQVKEIGAAMQQGIDRSVEELSNSLPLIEKELSEIEGQIQQAVPALRERLKNFARQLEESLKAVPEEQNPKLAPDQPIEI